MEREAEKGDRQGGGPGEAAQWQKCAGEGVGAAYAQFAETIIVVRMQQSTLPCGCINKRILGEVVAEGGWGCSS